MYYLYYTLSILVHVEGILTATAMIWRTERYFFRIFLNYRFFAQFYPWPSIWRRSVHSNLNSPFILYDIYPRFVYTPVLPLSRTQIFFKTETVLLDCWQREQYFLYAVIFACLRLIVPKIINHYTRVQCTWWRYDTFCFQRTLAQKSESRISSCLP